MRVTIGYRRRFLTSHVDWRRPGQPLHPIDTLPGESRIMQGAKSLAKTIMLLASLLVPIVIAHSRLEAQTQKVQRAEATANTVSQATSLGSGSTLPGASEFQRGWRLDKGVGEKVDHNRALVAYRNAMVAGHPLALAAYGFLMFKDDVKGNDPFLAEQICRASADGVKALADNGDPTAMVLLGRLILNKHIDAEWKKGKNYYFKEAAERGDAYGQLLCGNLYWDNEEDDVNDVSVPDDISKAIMWYEKSAAQDYSEAYYSLAMALDRSNTRTPWETIVTLLRKASERDVLAAHLQLKEWHKEEQRGLKYEQETIWRLHVRAAELGDYDAMKSMARYYEGIGEKKAMWEWDEKANNQRKVTLNFGAALANRDRKFDLKEYLAEERETIARENVDANRRANPNNDNSK